MMVYVMYVKKNWEIGEFLAYHLLQEILLERDDHIFSAMSNLRMISYCGTR